jgi:DNA-directed RNA polymerase specialized sigma24 family protein
MQVKEIAKYLKESENVISVRIHRGIEKMKSMIKVRNKEFDTENTQKNK